MRNTSEGIMKRFISYIWIAVLVLPLTACTSNYRELSSETGFTQYIGQSYVLKNDMSMRGINLPPGYGETIDVYMVNKLYKVRHKAPEEITFDIFPKGSVFVISGVYECTSCLSFSKVRHVSITTEDFEKTVKVPITMPMHEIVSSENIELVK